MKKVFLVFSLVSVFFDGECMFEQKGRHEVPTGIDWVFLDQQWSRQREIVDSCTVDPQRKYHEDVFSGAISESDLEGVAKCLNSDKELILVSSNSGKMSDRDIMVIMNWLAKHDYDSNLFRFIWLDRSSFFEELGMGSQLPDGLLGTQYILYFSHKQ